MKFNVLMLKTKKGITFEKEAFAIINNRDEMAFKSLERP